MSTPLPLDNPADLARDRVWGSDLLALRAGLLAGAPDPSRVDCQRIDSMVASFAAICCRRDAAKMTKRQVAVLAGDIVGYCRLIEADPSDTIARLTGLRGGLVEPAAEYFHAVLTKYAGDAILLAFENPADALECAITLQSVLLLLNVATPEQQRMSFRMGISVGEAYFVDGDIHGMGVNIAARLEALAGAGEIWLCEEAFRHVCQLVPMEFQSLGERRLHNISAPVRAFRISLGTIRQFANVHAAGTDRRDLRPGEIAPGLRQGGTARGDA